MSQLAKYLQDIHVKGGRGCLSNYYGEMTALYGTDRLAGHFSSMLDELVTMVGVYNVFKLIDAKAAVEARIKELEAQK